MRKLKKLNGAICEWNGLMAKLSKDKTEENQEKADECLLRIKQEVDKILE